MTQWHTQHQHDDGFLIYKATSQQWLAVQPTDSDIAEDALPAGITGIAYCPWCGDDLNEDGTTSARIPEEWT